MTLLGFAERPPSGPTHALEAQRNPAGDGALAAGQLCALDIGPEGGAVSSVLRKASLGTQPASFSRFTKNKTKRTKRHGRQWPSMAPHGPGDGEAARVQGADERQDPVPSAPTA